MISENAEISGVTDKSGFLILKGLKSGVYLIREAQGNSYGKISPFLVSLPYSENGTTKSFIEIEPKASPPDFSLTPIPEEETPFPQETIFPVPFEKTESPASPVKTGDFTETYPYLIMAGLALWTAIILLHKKKEGPL